MPNKKEVVKVSQLNKTFMSKNGVVKAIDNVSFSIKKGEIVGLIGESGSGKTTIGRALLRLHIADSGSIQISGHEYGPKKISKKTEKALRNNAQMIFQDPYSSLNGQKNILHIVSEPLLVNGTDKKMVKEYLKDRKQMLIFFKSALNTYFFESKWEHDKLIYSERIEAYKNIIEELSKLRFEKSDVKLAMFNVVVGTYYKKLASAHTNIINSSSENLNNFFTKWKELKSKLKESQVDDWDEIALLDAEKKYEVSQMNLKSSSETRKTLEEIKTLKDEIKELKDSKQQMNIVSNEVFKELIEQYKLDIKEAKINMPLASTYGLQNYLQASIVKDKKIIHELSKTMNNDKQFLSVDADELNEAVLATVANVYKDVFEQYKTESKDAGTPKKKYSTIHEELEQCEWTEGNAYNKYLSKLLTENKSIIQEFEDNIKERELLIERKQQILSTLKEQDSTRDQKDLKYKVYSASDELTNAKKDNEHERKTFAAKYKQEFAALKVKTEKEIEDLKQEYLDMKAKAELAYKKKFDFVESFETEFLISEEETKQNKSELKKLVDQSTKDKKDKNAALRNEWKRLDKYQGIVQELFGIKASFNLRERLRKLLVRLEVFATLQHAGLQPAHAFRYPHEFSGGMRQRVGIARAIINKPDFIIADEPIAALDLSIQAQVVNMLLEQKERLGLAMLFIAHDLSMVRFNSDRILIMHLGKLVEYGETEEIFNNPRHPYTKNLIKTMPSLNNLAQGFKDSTFEPEYLEPYTMSNRPFYVQVGNKDHFVLADKAQAKEWVGTTKRASKQKKAVEEKPTKPVAKEEIIKALKEQNSDLDKQLEKEPVEKSVKPSTSKPAEKAKPAAKPEVKKAPVKKAKPAAKPEVKKAPAKKDKPAAKPETKKVAPVVKPETKDEPKEIKQSKTAKKSKTPKKYTSKKAPNKRMLRSLPIKDRRAKNISAGNKAASKPAAKPETKKVPAKSTKPVATKKPAAKKTTPAKKPVVKSTKPVTKKAKPASVKTNNRKEGMKVSAKRRQSKATKPSRRSQKPTRNKKYSLKSGR